MEREKAIAHVKDMYEHMLFREDKEALETLIPELRENEDERIRKWIIALIKSNEYGSISNVGEMPCSKLNILSWLEKQKDASKAIEAVERIDKYIDEHLANAHDMKDSNSEKEYYLGWDAALGKMAGILQDVYSGDEQKEQKPAEVDESTKRLNDNWMKQHFDDYEEQKPAKWSEEKEKAVDNYADEIIKWEDAHKDWDSQVIRATAYHFFNLQPKQEWSEEDEKIIWGLTAYIPNEELERLGITRDDILKKLKSIRPQPIQLKEAYKEGFQTARHAMALAFMNYLDENRPDGKMGLSNGECEDIDEAFKKGDWAKIMRYYEKYRPHWKPSGEHMEALHIASYGADPTPESILALAGLYEQLKQL